VATTRRKASSSAISTVSVAVSPVSNGRRVHRMTPSGAGSPEATPSGKRSRRSRQLVRVARAGPAQASAAPIAAAADMNSRRFRVIVPSSRFQGRAARRQAERNGFSTKGAGRQRNLGCSSLLLGEMSRSPCPAGMASDHKAIRTCPGWG
jgi:hypothetical protein